MKKALLFSWIILVSTFSSLAQSNFWTFEELGSMPESISNNAVATATVDGAPYLYSFSGIDNSKMHSGISLKSFRYNTSTDEWETIAPLPDGQTRIAAAASTVKNKIYIIGGYHVFENENEVSVDRVHIYDPETNAYLENGSPIPIPIDDQVQAVYKDSLIYVVTGWSNSNNTAAVQIYDPTNDTWTQGAAVPNSNDYKVFGSSGAIIGDTIYYIGGARFGSNFPLTAFLRKGYIHPDDPTQIDWSIEDSFAGLGYRMAATTLGNNIIWIGGSQVSYNYDGISYFSGEGVPPIPRVLKYNPESGQLSEDWGSVPAVMDLRGIGKISDTEFLIAGGMIENQQVTDQTFHLTFNNILDVEELNTDETPALYWDHQYLQLPEHISLQSLEIYSLSGELMIRVNEIKQSKINIQSLNPAMYIVKLQTPEDEQFAYKITKFN